VLFFTFCCHPALSAAIPRDPGHDAAGPLSERRETDAAVVIANSESQY
jgi:hypothetical protein